MDFLVELIRTLFAFIFFGGVALGGIFLGKTLRNKKSNADAVESEN